MDHAIPAEHDEALGTGGDSTTGVRRRGGGIGTGEIDDMTTERTESVEHLAGRTGRAASSRLRAHEDVDVAHRPR